MFKKKTGKFTNLNCLKQVLFIGTSKIDLHLFEITLSFYNLTLIRHKDQPRSHAPAWEGIASWPVGVQ
ncbi:MAG: hypothetical protein GXO75_11000 [Calditrichaeota bacterium]|nr:hypothetical protein [Calditrichota bacterium]